MSEHTNADALEALFIVADDGDQHLWIDGRRVRTWSGTASVDDVCDAVFGARDWPKTVVLHEDEDRDAVVTERLIIGGALVGEWEDGLDCYPIDVLERLLEAGLITLARWPERVGGGA